MAVKKQSTFPVIIQFILLLVSAALYFLLTTIGDFRIHLAKYYLIITPLYIIYFYMIILSLMENEKQSFLPIKWIIFFSILFRLCLLPVKHIPAVAQFIPVPDMPVLVLKLILILAEAGLVVAVLVVVNYFRLTKKRIVILIFNPLLIIEIYYFGQAVIIVLALFWAAIMLFYHKRSWCSVPLFALSAAGKLFAITAALPFLIKKFRYKVMILAAVSGLIFLCTGFRWIISSYAKMIPAGGFFYSIFLLIRERVSGLIPDTQISEYPAVYIGIMTCMIVIVAIDQLNKAQRFGAYYSITYLEASLMLTTVTVLLLPEFYPWLLLWIIPYMIFIPKWSWLGFTFLIQLTYLNPVTGFWSGLLLIYVPFFTLLLTEYYDRRKIKGWLL